MECPLKVVSTGVTINVTSAALLTCQLLPTNAAGEYPRESLLTVDTGVVYVKLGAINTPGSAMTPTLNDLMVNSTYPLLLNTRGQAIINVLTRTGTANLGITPIEA